MHIYLGLQVYSEEPNQISIRVYNLIIKQLHKTVCTVSNVNDINSYMSQYYPTIYMLHFYVTYNVLLTLFQPGGGGAKFACTFFIT